MKRLLLMLLASALLLLPSCREVRGEGAKGMGAEKTVFYFFHSESCPHCRHAQPFVAELEKKYSDVEFRKLEVSHDAVNRALFDRKLKELGIKGGGVPLFVCGKEYVVGYTDDFKQKIEDLIVRKLSGSKK